MIEVILKDYLQSKLEIPVLLEVPKEVPSKYVLMQQIDAGEVNHINSATFTFDVYDKTLYKASVLAEKVIEELNNSVELDAISKAFLGGKSSGISTTKQYDYVITFNFYYYN